MTMSGQETGEKDTPKESRSPVFLRHPWIWLVVACIAAAGAFVFFSKSAGTSSRTARQNVVRSMPVVAATARKGDIRIYLTGLGSVTPLSTVTVKTRVDGQLMKVLFKEGQIVSSGYLLAEIDPRPFETQLTQAEGQMVHDQALLKNARLDLERYKVLVEQDSVSRQTLDTQEALVHQYEGAVKVDQGLIDNAKLQLVYSRITSPISGRIGLRLVDPGNIVHAADAGGLAVITQLQPITVIFSIPEDNLPSVLSKLKAGERLQVEAFDREQNRKIAAGYLLTVDNQIDPTTGTVRLKAMFPNKENELFPNQFVNARLLLDTRKGVTIVPTAAIQRGIQGTFVYLIKADKTVSVRLVRTGPSEGDEVLVEEGLSPGDPVVVEGAERLREGSKIEMQGRTSNSPRKGK